MTDQDKATNTNESSGTGVIDSLINLGTATTKMTIDQVQNAFTALVHPVAAMEHVKDTMNSLSEAMNNTTSASRKTAAEPEPVSNDLRGAATGMEHLSYEAPTPQGHWAEMAEGHNGHTAKGNNPRSAGSGKQMNRRKS